MTSAERIKVALRAGLVAKRILDITDTTSARTAEFMLLTTADDFKKLVELLERFEKA
jgi:hypothetical protein